MATCTQALGGIQLDCTTSQGGIKKVWIARYDDVKPELKVMTPTENEIYNGLPTDYKMVTFTGATTVKDNFKVFEFRRGTASMTETDRKSVV